MPTNPNLLEIANLRRKVKELAHERDLLLDRVKELQETTVSPGEKKLPAKKVIDSGFPPK
jgi:hypothetical protein